MATSTVVSLNEYLRTSYSPDCDWIDGEVRERNMGEGPHANIQAFLIAWFYQRRKEWGIRVMPEQRVQTSVTHFRIPDVSITGSEVAFERIVRIPPLLCIEILSWDDRMSEIQERVDDYFGMGVAAVWVIDPRRRMAFSAEANGSLNAVTVVLKIAGTAIEVPVAEMFSELDELEGRS